MVCNTINRSIFWYINECSKKQQFAAPPKRNAEGEIELGFLFEVLWGIARAYISVFVMILSPNGDLGAILFATIGGIGGSNVVLSIVKKYNSDIDDKMEEKLNSSVLSKAKSNSDGKNLDKKSG